ncbi:MAG: hypothetical protein RRA94_11365 [Bacteroidota bacterium]|nr:hypothetical protein [Bacteroidota bacterium]
MMKGKDSMFQNIRNESARPEPSQVKPGILAPDENDPLFENLVRFVTRHCLQFVEMHGGGPDDYYIGAAADAHRQLLEFHRIPDDTPYFIRDGLHTTAARSIKQQLVLKGCRGVGYVEADDSLKLYMYKILPGVTVEDD